MLAAYIADPQIGAIADFYMPEMKDRQWQKERMEAFEEACDLAVQKGAELVLLAGSVFAEEYIPDAVIAQVLEGIRGRKAVFVWNPDRVGREYLKHRADIPSNFFVLNSGGNGSFLWKDAQVGVWPGRERGDEEANVLLAAGASAFVREGQNFRREAVGKLENTGFDDPEDSGFVLFGLEDDYIAVYRKCAAATASFTKHDFVRIVLKGRVDVEAFVRANTLRENLEARFFYLEVFNDCRLELDEEAYANDISLKSEMIRMVLGDDSLSESEKSRIIQCGWNALRGKELPE